MAFLAPPASYYTIWQDNDIFGVGLAIYDEASEAVRFNLWRVQPSLTSFRRPGKGFSMSSEHGLLYSKRQRMPSRGAETSFELLLDKHCTTF